MKYILEIIGFTVLALFIWFCFYDKINGNNPEIDKAKSAILEAEQKYRYDSILIESDARLKIEKYKAKK